MSWPWSELGLPGPADLPAVRHAYAQRLKTTHPEEDPAGFQRLHDAYRFACRLARQAGTAPPVPEDAQTAPEEEWDAGLDQEEESENGPESADGDWAFNRLPEEDGPREPGAAPQADWDFERLFAERQAEEDEALRRKAEERRRKNWERYAGQERTCGAAQERAWAAASAALHALELLYAAGAPLRIWKEFFSSETFWSARGNLDFVFGLEEFLELHPELPVEIRRAIFRAYGFDAGPVPQRFRPLYRRLGLSMQEQRRLRRAGGAWGRMPRRQRIATVLGVAWLGLLALAAFLIPLLEKKDADPVSWQEQMCAWLEEDYGGHFVHPYEELAYSCIFIATDHPDVLFFASAEGTRDLEHGQRGYQTNYPDALVRAALEDFAARQGVELSFDSAGGFRDAPGETPGAYLFSLPLTGAGEVIDALGEELERLAQADWYQPAPPEFQVYLGFHGMSFYDMVSTRDRFDADYARSRYETQLGPELCRFLAEESGAAARHWGEDGYVLLERGSVTLEGETFFWASALEKPPSNRELGQYFLSADGRMLFCMRADIIGQPLTLEELYRAPARTVTVPTTGKNTIAVTVWDHLQTE